MFFYRCVRIAVRILRLSPTCGVLPLILFAQSARAETLTLADALSRAVGGNPSAAVNAAELTAANAGVTQAQARPRDVIGVDMEDFAGSGPYAPVDRAQTTAWYERTIERGGKREARISAARSEIGVAAQRNHVRMLDVLQEVQTAWIEALAAEAQIAVAERSAANAQRLESEVARRVARALDPRFALERARTQLTQARIAVDQARANARITRAGLAAFWNGSADYQIDMAALDMAGASYGPRQTTPDLALLGARRDAAEARVRLAETNNFGDPTARLGVRHFRDGSDVALMVGGSIPLGNRAANRGNVDRARAEQQAAEAEIAVAEQARQRETNRLVGERDAVADEIGRIDHDVIPGAERAATQARDGFNRGGTAFTFLELSQAQQAVTDARIRRLDLLRRFHLLGARLDRLSGRHLPLIASVENR